MGWPIPGRLQNRLSLVLVLALILPVSVVAWYAVHKSTQALVRTVEIDHLQNLKVRVSDAQALLEQPRADLYELSQNPRLRLVLDLNVAQRGAREIEIEDLLRSFVDRSAGLYARAYWIDEKGQVPIATDAVGHGLAPAISAALFSGAGQLVSIPGRQSIFIGAMTVQTNPSGGLDASEIPYALSMRRSDGGIGGVLVVELDAKRVFGELARTHEGTQQTHTWVLDRSGKSLVKPSNAATDDWALQRPHDCKEILTRTSGALFDTVDQPDALQVFARLRPMGQSAIQWTVVDQIPLSAAMAQIRTAQSIIVALSLGCLLLAWWGARQVTRSIVRPLESLALAAQQIGEQDHDSPLPTKTGAREITDLALAFEAMRSRIRRLLSDLRRSTSMLETSQQLSLTGGWEVDPQHYTVRWTEQTYRIFELPQPDPIVEMPVAEALLYYVPQSIPVLKSALDLALAQGTPFDLTLQIRTASNRLRWVNVVSQATSSEGRTVKLSGAIQDITERQEAQEALRIAATAFESQQGMTVTDTNTVILRVNSAFTEITGYSEEEAVGQTTSMLRSGRHDASFYAIMWRSLNTTGGWQGEIWNRRKNGEIYPEWRMITAVKDHGGAVTHYVSSFVDITQRKKAEEEVHDLAFYDPLTHLPNRRLLLDRLKQALASSGRNKRHGALLFIDLDNFRNLNDTLGHDVGDLLLQQVAQRLLTCVREGDTLARIGGDEFVVMLEDLSKTPVDAANQAETVGEKILQTLNLPYELEGALHHSTPSIGVTLFADHRTGVDELLKRADLAMYQAKAVGRNNMRFFDPEMQAVIATRSALEADLRAAIEGSQFLLYYQAQVVGDGHLIGAEALLRWPHPVRGMVSPGVFIPVAEETDLIVPLGLWVLETACAQLAQWATHPEMAHLTLAVNVSARQLRLPTFVQDVLTTIERSGANPHRLKLELTESLLVKDVEDVITKMSALKARGVGFSLDDFGTGYSSLSYLKRLPLDQLKIDQGFVRNILTDPNDAAIAKMIVALAESMGLTVIAEGVEIEVQKVFLARLGCHAYQGYLFSRPLPLADFEAFVRQT